MSQHTELVELVSRLRELLAKRAAAKSSMEFDRLNAAIADAVQPLLDAIKALSVIANGDEPRPIGKTWQEDGTLSKHDKCIHDRWMYEDCGNCVAEFARKALGEQP